MGVWLADVGAGATFYEAATRTLNAGAFISLKANQAHFVTTNNGAVVQIFGPGPFAIEYVPPGVTRDSGQLAAAPTED